MAKGVIDIQPTVAGHGQQVTLRLAGFLLGGYYFDESIVQDSLLLTGSDARPFFSLLAGNPQVFNGVELALGLPQNSIFSPGLLTSEAYSMENQSYSIFGTIDLEPVDGLVFTAGFNYTDDQKEFALAGHAFDAGPASVETIRAAFAQANPVAFGQIAAAAQSPAQNPLLGLTPFQFQPPFLTIPNAVEDGETSDDKFTYLLRASYQATNEVNVYFSYATGFKASSVNLSRDSRPVFGDYIPGPGRSQILAPPSPILNAGLAIPNLTTGSRFAGPEEAEVYELGIKGQWPGWGFNLAVFDQTIKGFQSFLFTGTGFQLNNAGQQSVRGFEFDTTINPTDGLVLTFAATHLRGDLRMRVAEQAGQGDHLAMVLG